MIVRTLLPLGFAALLCIAGCEPAPIPTAASMPCVKSDDWKGMCNAACGSDECLVVYCDQVDKQGCCTDINGQCSRLDDGGNPGEVAFR